MKRALGMAAAFLLGVAAAVAADPPVLWQKPVGAWTCGPCSIYNALQFGAAPLPALGAGLPGATPEAKAAALIATYGTRPSLPFAGRRPRYLDGKGTPPDDETAMLNDVLHDLGAPGAPAKGDYLNQLPGETGPRQLARVRDLLLRSIAAGLPPIAELVSYAAQPSAKGDGGFVWNVLEGHYVVVIGAGDLPDGAPGFTVRLADSYTGRVQQAFVVAEVNRPFGASRGYVLQPDGTEKPIWVKGIPLPATDRARPAAGDAEGRLAHPHHDRPALPGVPALSRHSRENCRIRVTTPTAASAAWRPGPGERS